MASSQPQDNPDVREPSAADILVGIRQDADAHPNEGRRRRGVSFIDNKHRRHVTFSKRKKGLMKKAYELTTLTEAEVLVVVASETGQVYTFATRKLRPVIATEEGKAIIQAYLNAPPDDGGDRPDPEAPNPTDA